MEIYERKTISMFVMILEKSPSFEDRGGEILHLYPQKIGLYRGLLEYGWKIAVTVVHW